ncbi:MAG: hypothetical protein Q9170_001608 [Blastenia crenularia]
MICSGYRDTNSPRIRDETTAVQKRVSKKQVPQTAPQSFPIPVGSQARDLFYLNYVVGSTKPFNFLLPFCSTSSKDQILNQSIDAVSLAYLNYQRHSLSAEEEARQHYASAIRSIGTALRSPNEAKQDSTILAILLLDLYEKITSKDSKHQTAWIAHLDGALALVKLRDGHQFNDPTVIRMLMRLSTNLLISSVVNDRPISSDLIALRSTISTNFPLSVDPKWRESDLMIEFGSLRQNIQNGVVSDNEAILTLLDLDSKFVKLGLEAPSAWRYQTVQVKTMSSHHYQSFHLIHPAEHVTQMWNTLRLTRISLNEIICYRCLYCLGRQSSNLDVFAIHHRATEVIQEMASDICASLPQYIQDPNTPFIEAPTGSERSTALSVSKIEVHRPPTGQSNPTHHLPCYRLIFPLFVTAQSSAGSPSLRKWVIEQLRFMADYHAIENAMSVAKILESGERPRMWSVYAMLGSYAFVC